MPETYAGMSFRLKLILGILIVAIVLIVSYGAHSFLNTSSRSTSSANNTRNADNDSLLGDAESDTDHDGLLDEDEGRYDLDPFKADTDGDGYLDGEEVATGFDPIEKDPAKDLRQGNTSESLTTSYVDNFIGGYLSGDLDLETADAQTYTQSASILSYATLDEGTARKPTSLAVLVDYDSDEEAIKAYLEKAVRILSVIPQQDKYLSLGNFTSTEEIVAKTTTWKTLGYFFKMAGLNLAKLEAPRQVLDWHTKTLEATQNAAVFYDALAGIYQDPVLALTKIEYMDAVISDLVIQGNDLNILLKKYGSTKVLHYLVHIPDDGI